MDIQVSQKMTLKIGEHTFEITTQEAEKLYSELFSILGKHNQFQLTYPSGVRGPTFGPAYANCGDNVALLSKGNQ